MTRIRSANRAEGRTAKQRPTEQGKLGGKETIGYTKTHRANRSTQRTKTLRQHGRGEGQGAQKNRKEGATVLDQRSTEAARLTQEKLARRRLGLKKGLGDSQRQRGKPKSKTYRQGKTSSGYDGSKNDRQRRVSTEMKRQGAKLAIERRQKT